MSTITSSVPAVVVVNYGSSHLLSTYLRSTVAHQPAVWVVDNLSTPEERTRVTLLAERQGWNLVALAENRGFGAGVNAGVRAAVAAGATEIVVLNPDLQLSPQALAALVGAVRENPASLISPRVLRPDGSTYSQGHDLVWASGLMRSSARRTSTHVSERLGPWLTGAVWAFSAAVWQRVGPLEEDFFLYWEDVEWCVRAQRRGISLRVLPEVVAVHDDGGTQAEQRPHGYSKSAGYVYYCVRNRLLYARRSLTGLDRLRWWFHTPTAVWTVLGHGGRRPLLRTTAPWLAAAEGVRDGVRGIVGPRRSVAAAAPTSSSRTVATVHVLQTYPPHRPTTNPYIVMLQRALRSTSGVESHTFSWRTALVGRYDVVHAHWPENLTQGASAVKSLGKCVVFAAWCLRLWALGVPVVRTTHNLHPPSGMGWLRDTLLRCFDRLTVREIHLNPCTPSNRPHDLIVHGHYREWFAAFPRSEPVPGRLAFVGLVRRYKGVTELVTAWRGVQAEGSLHITGMVSSPELEAEIRAVADQRVVFDARFVDDGVWAERVTQAVCVVLPYRHMHNSGTVLAALSLGRPVLVPRSAVTDLLAAEVGERWVLRYDGALTSDVLEGAIRQATQVLADGGAPNLSARDWGNAGEMHGRTYRLARGVSGP